MLIFRQKAPRSATFLLLLLACIALRVTGLFRTCLSDDEATYCVVAREMLAGRVLYKDVVDHKPPLIYLTYEATQFLGGPVFGMRLLHLVTALVVFGTAVLLWLVTRQLAERRAIWTPEAGDGVFAATFYVLFTTTLLDFDALAANCELFMMLPLAASVLIYLRAHDKQGPWLDLATVGVLVAVAVLYKYQAAVNLGLYAIHLAVRYRHRPGRLLASWLALLSGFVAVMGICLGVLAHAHAAQAAWFWFRFNFVYMTQGVHGGDILKRVGRLAYGIGPSLFIWILALNAVMRTWFRPTGPRDTPPASPLIVGWLFASVVATTAGGRFFGHYFHQITAPLAILAAPAGRRLWTSRPRLLGAALAVPTLVFFLMGAFHGPVMALAGEPDPDYDSIAKFIDSHSLPEDRLVIWGNVPVLYFAANRPLGSRFVFSNYLTGLSPATRSQSDPTVDSSANVVPGSWAMLEADIKERRPTLFVDTAPGNLAAYGKFPLVHYPRLKAIVDADYRQIGEVSGTRIFARRSR